MPALRSAFQDFLADWRNDLSPYWIGPLTGVEPEPSAVPANLLLSAGERIFPGRKGQGGAGREG